MFFSVPLRKMFSALVCGLFLFNSIAYPFTPSQTSKTSQTSALTIPATLGNVTDTYTGDARKPCVILISDAHCNAEVQRNIAGVIASAKKTFGAKLVTVGVEGTAGKIDTSIVRDIPSAVLRNVLTQRMVERGYITGPELYDIMHPNSITLYGVEDTTLYAKNFHELKKGLAQEHAWRQGITIVRAALNHDWKQIKNPTLQKLHRFETSRDTQHIESYLAVLKTIPRAPPIQRTTYPNLFFHIESNRIFREVTMARLSSETKGLYKRVRKYFSVQEQKTLEAQKGQDYHLFVATLLELMKERRIAVPRAYSTVLQYQQGLEYQARVNSIVLLDEWEKYRYAAQCNCATTLDEKQLVYLTHMMNLFEAYCGNNATSASRATFEVNQPTFFRLLAQRYPYTNLNPIKTCTSSMQTFYSTAIKRNEAMVRNLLSQKGSVYVLVAGGFHEDGLKAYLRSKGCSYTAVLPAISDDKGKSKALYRARLFSQDNRVSANTSLALTSVFVNRDAYAVTMLEQSRRDLLQLYQAHVVTTGALHSFLEYFKKIATRDNNAALAEWLQRFSREIFESCFTSTEITIAAMEEGGVFDVLVPGWAGKEGIREKLKAKYGWVGMGARGQREQIHIFEHIQNTIRTVDDVVDEATRDRAMFPQGMSDDAKNSLKRQLRFVMFFHDFGKSGDEVVGGKKDARIHELNSERMARPVLMQLGYTGAELEEICFFIKYHGTMGAVGEGWDARFNVAPDKSGFDAWLTACKDPFIITKLVMIFMCDVRGRGRIGERWNIERIKTVAQLMKQQRFGSAGEREDASKKRDIFLGNYKKIFTATAAVRTRFPFLDDHVFSDARGAMCNAMYDRYHTVLTERDVTSEELAWMQGQGVRYVALSSTALHKGTFREILANAWEAVKDTVSATGRAVSESFGLLQSFAQRRGTPERQVTPQDMAAVLDSVAAAKRVELGRQEQKTADDLLAEMQGQGVRVDNVRVFDLPLANADSWLKVFVYEGVVYISKDLVEMIVRGVVRTEEVAKHEEIEVKVEQALQTRKRVPKKAVWDVLSRHGMSDKDKDRYHAKYQGFVSHYSLTDEEERMECAHQLTLLIPEQRAFYDTVDRWVDVKPMMSEQEYTQFMRGEYGKLLTPEQRAAVMSVNPHHVRLMDANDHWYNLTLDADFHGDATLFNLWTLRRARRLFSRMKLWQHWQSMEKDELDVTEFPPDRAYRLAKGDDTRDIVGIGDVHGDLNMMVLPLVREEICTVTGDLVWYDVKNHRRADPGEITRDTVQNYILIPDLAFVPGVDRRLVVQFLGDIIDRGEWTDECYFLLEDFFARAPEGLMSGVFGNHDLSVGRPEFDLLSGNIFGRQKYIREGFDHLLESGRYTVARAVRGIWVSHSFPDKNFIEVLLENMDENSLGSTNAVREHEASLNLRGFVGDTTGRYARVPGILERMRDSRKDPTISISPPDLELVIEFLNAIFRKGILSDDPDDVQVVRSLFWINNLGRNPHCLTRDRFCNILWAMVHQMGGMLNVSQVFGHDARVSPSPKGRLKVRADLDGSYATQDDGYPRPCYFKIDGTNGKVWRIEFANPRRVFVGDVAEVPALSFDSLFDSAASIERAIADGTFGVLMPPRAIRKDEFDALQFVRNKEALWQELIQQGYIDENGILQPAFKTIVATHLQDTDHPSKQLQLTGYSDGRKQEIYNVLARGLGWTEWWERLATQQTPSYGPQETTQGHILQTIRNVDEVVDSMVRQGLVPSRGVEQYKRRARLLMLFHDIGKAFDDDNRDDRYGPQRQHGSLSGVIFRELFTRLRYTQDAINRDCYVIENHAAPGMLGAGLLWFNEGNHHEITERGLDVVDFAQGFADEQEVGMLNVVALCDMLHRTPFLHDTGNLTKINEVCARMRDVVNDRGNEAAQDRLVDYLWYRGQIRAAVDREANSLRAVLHHWIPRVSITNMIAMVMYFRKRAFLLTDTDMETIHRLKSAA